MSGIKTFSNETSERYALALFELANENSEIEEIERNTLFFLDTFSKNPEFKNFLKNPTYQQDIQIQIFTEISKSLINGQDVKISSFGTFIVRNKRERVGRNPKTGEEVPITARQVVTFRASNVLKSEVSDLSKIDTSSETENR